jgi:hypothetical protein
MTSGTQSPVDRMRGQAERAIASSKSRNTIMPLLERLVRAAEPGSEAARFAHRHLAEYLVEQNPWRALGHLRHARRDEAKSSPRDLVMDDGRDDDALNALAGLAHALLGNYRSAIGAYRRAVALVPSNPWYQHNLGHLLDVGIDRPELALAHLEAAHRSAGPDDGEISASLAHCLARLRRLPAALAHAEVAVATCPDNADHRRLREWILAGAIEADPSARDAARNDRPKGDAPIDPPAGEPASAVPAVGTSPGALDAVPAGDDGPRRSGAGNAARGRAGQSRAGHERGGQRRADQGRASNGAASGGTAADLASASARSVSQPEAGTHPGDVAAPARPRRPRRSAAVTRLARRIHERLRATGHSERDAAGVMRLWDRYGATLTPDQLESVAEGLWFALAELAAGLVVDAPEVATQSPRAEALAAIAQRHGVSPEQLRARWAELDAHRQKAGGPRRARR